MKEMTLRELQLFSLSILKDVHAFCESNNICYSLAYGTLIGAIRHKAFIPWDDDVDIIMPRPDYEKFCKMYTSPKYKIALPKDSYICFTRVYDNQKTFSVQSVPWLKSNHRPGVWIDIFPIDSISDNEADFQKQYNEANKLLWLQGKVRSTKKEIKDMLILRSFSQTIIKMLRAWLGKIVMFCHPIDKVNEAYQKVINKYTWGLTEHWAQLACADNGAKDFGHISWLSSYILLPFEDAHFYVLKGYHEWLSNKYGDYMVLPPEKEQEQHTLDITKFYWK